MSKVSRQVRFQTNEPPDDLLMNHRDQGARGFPQSESCLRAKAGSESTVVESAGIDPGRTAFVDDKMENVVLVRPFGLKSIISTSFDEAVCELRTPVWNAIIDGERYLRAEHAKEMKTVTNTGVLKRILSNSSSTSSKPQEIQA